MDDYNSHEGVVEGYELYQPGLYTVTYQRHELISPKGFQGRIILWFVFTEGVNKGEEVPFFCKVTRAIRKTGAFSVRKNSKYVKTITALTKRKYKRNDRISPLQLRGLKLQANVVTVTTRRDKSTYSDEDKYSKVDTLELLQ